MLRNAYACFLLFCSVRRLFSQTYQFTVCSCRFVCSPLFHFCQVFLTEQTDHILYHLLIPVCQNTGCQPIGIRSLIVLFQRIRITSVPEFDMISGRGCIRKQEELFEFSRVLILCLIEIAVHQPLHQGSFSRKRILMAENLFSVLIQTAYRVSVKNKL